MRTEDAVNKVHELKTHPLPFERVLSGEKTFELRQDDGRDFRVGDALWLREFDPEAQGMPTFPPGVYSGRSLTVVVTYIVRAPAYGLIGRMCVMSIKKVSR